MSKPSAWSSWETKARHGVMAAGLGAMASILGSWISTWLPLPSHSPFVAHVFAGWIWNAWLWLVFAPIAFVVCRVFPVKTTSFVVMGGVSGFLFWFFLNTALFGFEIFLELPLYALSCLFWFVTGLLWAMGFARRGKHAFLKAQENAEAISKSNERYYAQWLAASENLSAAGANTPAVAQAPSSEAETKHAPEL